MSHHVSGLSAAAIAVIVAVPPAVSRLVQAPEGNAAETPSLVLPFEHGNRDAILVRTQVNGRPALMLLDTGASNSVVSPELVDLNAGDLEIARFRKGPGLGGEALAVRTTVRLGDVIWRNHPVVVMNLSEVRRVYGQPLDGILGEDLLCSFSSARFDFKKGSIAFYR